MATTSEIWETVDEFGGRPYFDCTPNPMISIKHDQFSDMYLNPEAARWRPGIGWMTP